MKLSNNFKAIYCNELLFPVEKLNFNVDELEASVYWFAWEVLDILKITLKILPSAKKKAQM